MGSTSKSRTKDEDENDYDKSGATNELLRRFRLATDVLAFVAEAAHGFYFFDVSGGFGDFASGVAHVHFHFADAARGFKGRIRKRRDAPAHRDDESVHLGANVLGRLVNLLFHARNEFAEAGDGQLVIGDVAGDSGERGPTG